jgi:hypothetical protein
LDRFAYTHRKRENLAQPPPDLSYDQLQQTGTIILTPKENTMSTGRSNKLVGQTGEYLVAAELSRRGLIATTFTGNVPHYDIIASDETGRHVSVQVKAARGASWQFSNISHFCDVAFDGKRQILGDPRPCPVRGLVIVFVQIEDHRNDRFYILTWEQLRDTLVDRQKAFLERHGGIRPKRWNSLHAGLLEATLAPYRDKWETIENHLK